MAKMTAGQERPIHKKTEIESFQEKKIKENNKRKQQKKTTKENNKRKQQKKTKGGIYDV